MSDRNLRLITKQTSIAGKIPSGTTGNESNLIKQGELAINTFDQKLFSFDGTKVFEVGSKSFLRTDGNTATTGYVQAEGFVSAGGNATSILNPGGAYLSNNVTITGAIKITLPQSWTSTMMKFRIQIFEYSTNKTCDVVVAGYNYVVGTQWLNTTAYIITDTSNNRNFTIRFGHDGSKCCIYIGETNSIWSLPQVSVTEFFAGFLNYDAEMWNDNWSISFVSNFDNVSSTLTNKQIGRYIDNNLIWHEGNDGSGSGLDADLLDGLNGSDFFRQFNSSLDAIDLNNIKTSGSYRVNIGCLNMPINTYLSLVVVGNNTNVISQRATHFQTGESWIRSFNTSWSAWRKIWDSENDGSGSGLDADLLDGQQGSYYYPASNPNNYISTETDTLASVTARGSSTTSNITLSGTLGGDKTIKIGASRLADGNSYLDLIGDSTYTDYGLRMLRVGGMNGTTSILSRGTGNFNIMTLESAPIVFATNNSIRMVINSLGRVGIGTASPAFKLHVVGDSRLNGRAELDTINTQPTITNNNSFSIWFDSGSPTIRLKDNLGVESNITLWNNNNDGAGSGLDADLLDGQEGSYYFPESKYMSSTTISPGTDWDTLTTPGLYKNNGHANPNMPENFGNYALLKVSIAYNGSYIEQFAVHGSGNSMAVRRFSGTWSAWAYFLQSIDEDDMASNSAFRVPTQQSVKAYVDNNLSNISLQHFAVVYDSTTLLTALADTDIETILVADNILISTATSLIINSNNTKLVFGNQIEFKSTGLPWDTVNITWNDTTVTDDTLIKSELFFSTISSFIVTNTQGFNLKNVLTTDNISFVKSVGTNIKYEKGNLISGDVIQEYWDNTFVISNDSITNAKLSNMTQATIKGRANGSGTGDPQDLSASQVLDILKIVDGTGSGLDADLLDGVQGANFLQKTSNFLSKTFTLQSPSVGDNITIFRTDVAITVQQIIAVSIGATPSTTYQIKHSTGRNNVGTNVTGLETTTSLTTGNSANISPVQIPADSWVWVEISAASGTNVYLTIDIRYTIN